MKKLLVVMLLALVMMGCQTDPNMSEDPKLKESERISVIVKSKTDTTSLFIQMDDKNYVVKDDVIIMAGRKYEESPAGNFFFGVMIGSLFAVLLMNVTNNR